MLPYKLSDMVISKYLLSYLFILVYYTLVILSLITIGKYFSNPIEIDGIQEMLVILSTSLVFIAISLPPVFLLGFEKSRFIPAILAVIFSLINLNGASNDILFKIRVTACYYFYLQYLLI